MSTEQNLAVEETSTIETTNDVAAARTATLIAYGLMLSSLFLGITSIVGVIWAYIKRGECENTVYADHMSNIIKTFWISLVLGIVGVLTYVFMIGVVILIATAVYWIFKMVKGVAKAHSGKAYKA